MVYAYMFFTIFVLASPSIHASLVVGNDTVVTSYFPYDKAWQEFVKTYEKTYATSEEERDRSLIFLENVKTIELHNIRFMNKETTYYMGINYFTDMTNAEFAQYNGWKSTEKPKGRRCSTFLTFSGIQLPSSVDWRTQGFVTPVKNQGQCGSCWAFSTTGSLEGQTFKKTGKLISLSEQQLVDCSSSFGNDGCNGGLMDYAFRYIAVYGIESESSYPYRAKQGLCKYNARLVVAKDTGCMDIPRGSETGLKQAVSTVGPISVAIDSSRPSFQLYKGGVYDDTLCSSSRLDHGVLVAGYGNMSGKDYWLVKNSWGPLWGASGYIYMSRNKMNQCGIATQASYPLV